MTKTMYKTINNILKIEPIQVERETKHTLWVKNNNNTIQIRKESDYQAFHYTWEQALTHLIDKQHLKIESIKTQLKKEQAVLDQILAIKNTD